MPLLSLKKVTWSHCQKAAKMLYPPVCWLLLDQDQTQNEWNSDQVKKKLWKTFKKTYKTFAQKHCERLQDSLASWRQNTYVYIAINMSYRWSKRREATGHISQRVSLSTEMVPHIVMLTLWARDRVLQQLTHLLLGAVSSTPRFKTNIKGISK